MIIDALDLNLAGNDMKALTFELVERPLFVPDAIRDYRNLLRTVRRVTEGYGAEFRAIRHDDKLVGAFGVFNIVPQTDAEFALWIWDKTGLTHQTIRNIRDILTYMKDFHGLRRVTTHSADDRHVRILELIGFKIEGRFRHGYKSGGKFHNMYQLRIIGEL